MEENSPEKRTTFYINLNFQRDKDISYA